MEDKILELRALEEEIGIPWLSACYPLNPELLRSQPEDLRCRMWYKLQDLFTSAIKDYADDLVSGDPCPSTDIVSLLSSDGDHRDLVRNNGERISLNNAIFEGKYVLVCCFHVPVLLLGNDDFQPLINLCNELFSVRDDFEMVVVARMIGVADTRPVFDHFFSAFPESVLALPYEDYKRRNSICSLLDLSPELDCIQCLFLDTDGSVLPPFLSYEIMNQYGAEAFPFTREVVEDITAKCDELRRNGTLEQLLRPYESSPDDVSVYRFNDPGEVVNMSQFRNKHVGLFMFVKGNLISRLKKLYEDCREKQLDFEIVVLYCPNRMLEIFQDEMDGLMQEEDVRGWWCLPFNNSVSLRFSRLTFKYYNYTSNHDSGDDDKVIIVGPGGEILDMYGAEVIKYRKIDAYPFTREAFRDSEMKEAGEITLESVLVDDVFRGNDRSDVVSVDELLGKKKVVIYMASLSRYADYSGLVSLYEEMKTDEGSDPFEMVFFNANTEEEGMEISAMPWYVYPLHGTRSPSSIKMMKYPCQFFGFGVDGRMCSFSHGISLDNTLRKDVNRRYSLDDYQEI